MFLWCLSKYKERQKASNKWNNKIKKICFIRSALVLFIEKTQTHKNHNSWPKWENKECEISSSWLCFGYASIFFPRYLYFPNKITNQQTCNKNEMENIVIKKQIDNIQWSNNVFKVGCCYQLGRRQVPSTLLHKI